jgi:nicotinate dehydrogenase subunit A
LLGKVRIMSTVKELRVNGKVHALEADPDRTLLSVLRDDLSLSGAKYGCGEGKCGACTVLVEGKPIRSCRTQVDTVRDKNIQTIEGVAQGDRLHPLQTAFLQADALQCGYCTPGMILSALALLRETPAPSREEILRGMNGNICRCGTYRRIVEAIASAAREMKGGGK